MTQEHDSPAKRLEALGGMAAELDDANPDPEQQQAAQEEQAKAAESDVAAKQWGMLMYSIGGMACMIAPELRQVYSEERCFNWGQQANLVAEKYGWNGPSSMPELMLIASTAGFFVPTFFVVREKIKDAKEGNGPNSWLTKAAIWWRTRKARKAAMNPQAEGEDGSNQ